MEHGIPFFLLFEQCILWVREKLEDLRTVGCLRRWGGGVCVVIELCGLELDIVFEECESYTFMNEIFIELLFSQFIMDLDLWKLYL